jgi:F420-non-reducing hydrogenase small subunit
MGDKPKVAICWLGACGGCDEAIVDLNEALLDVVEAVSIELWPVAMDFKYNHLKAFRKDAIAVGLVSGHVRNAEHEEIAHLLRDRCRLIIALGACASFGGTPGLANLVRREEILDAVYVKAPSVVNPEGRLPQVETLREGESLHLPAFLDHVYALDQVIEVDYYLPGCPPPPELIRNGLRAVLTDDLPPKGSTLAPRKALCETCPRNKTKPMRLEIHGPIRRIHEVEADPEMCFLADGILCMGPATRTGCGETCIRTNTPCRGCFGPVPGVADPGSRFISSLAALLKVGTTGDPEAVMESIGDPVGYLYRFTHPVSILGDRRLNQATEEIP